MWQLWFLVFVGALQLCGYARARWPLCDGRHVNGMARDVLRTPP